MSLAMRHRGRQCAARGLARVGLLLCLVAAGPAGGQERDPALAPPLEELQAKAERWQERRRTGALVLLGGLAVASVLIGVARHRARRARRDAARSRPPVDKSPSPPPR